MQWYFVFAKEVPQIGAEFFQKNWGLLLCLTGIAGGFTGGLLSDKLFHSRRGPPAAIMSGIMLVVTAVMAVAIMNSPFTLGLCAMVLMFAVIGVHSLMSGTAAADFGGRKATATASGIVDGCVYLGSGLQSVCLGYITTWNWRFWPVFLIPFAAAGMILAWRIWHELPEATRRYIKKVENVEVAKGGGALAFAPATLAVTDGET
jgi:OPA family glycerol-3-phosphate transporter-like MFS transporter